MPGNVRTVYEKCSTACTGLFEPVRASRMLPHDLPPWWVVINKPCDGWPQAVLLLWLTICAYCCGKPKGATGSPRRPSLTVEPCNRRRDPWQPCGLRRSQATQRQQSACGSRYGCRNLLSLLVIPANEQDRAQVGELAQAVQEVTGQSVAHRLRRCWLHRRCSSRGSQSTRYPIGGRQTGRRPSEVLSCCLGDG